MRKGFCAGLAAIGVVAALAATAPSSGAATSGRTMTIVNGLLTVTDPPGTNGAIAAQNITRGGVTNISGNLPIAVLPKGCRRFAPGSTGRYAYQYHCPGVRDISLFGGDGNDTLSVVARFGAGQAFGGPDNDDIFVNKGVAWATAVAYGGDGNDEVTVVGNGSIAYGGADNDVLRAGYGVSGAIQTGSQTLVGDRGADELFADGGADTLIGGLGDDTMHGRGGRDTFQPGPGIDTVFGSTGKDTIDAVDNERDTLFCGGGHDIVKADTIDARTSC